MNQKRVWGKMREAINDRVMGREKFPIRRRMKPAAPWTGQVWGTTMEVKEKAVRMRRKKQELIQVRRSIVRNGSQSQGKATMDFRLFIRNGTHNLRSKSYIFSRSLAARFQRI